MRTRGRGEREELQPRKWRCLYCPVEKPNVITIVGPPPDRCEKCGNRAAFIAEDASDRAHRRDQP